MVDGRIAAAAVQKALKHRVEATAVAVIPNNLAIVVDAIRLCDSCAGIVDGRIAAAAVQKALIHPGGAMEIVTVQSNDLA